MDDQIPKAWEDAVVAAQIAAERAETAKRQWQLDSSRENRLIYWQALQELSELLEMCNNLEGSKLQ